MFTKKQELKDFAGFIIQEFKPSFEGSEKERLSKFKYENRLFDLTTMEGTKKYLKHLYKKAFPVYKNRMPKGLINHICREDESGESRIDVYIFHKEDDTMDRIRNNMNLEGDDNHYDYSPTGFWFRSRADIIEADDRIIVMQGCSLDC